MKLEIFYDYLCEFCEIGHRYWAQLLPHYPGITPVWRPCEAHPRALEPWGRHSDLAIQGLLYLLEQGGDGARYNQLLFDGVYRGREEIENPRFLARAAALAGAQEQGCLAALRQGAYRAAQQEANRYAYEVCQVQAVPTFVREDGLRLDAVLGVGVTRQQLEALLGAAPQKKLL